ncbi:hypothetical protein F5X98DRAFT_11693 [Xylaria grammica]|nr:hypothetical protein F5X98DRAFT_11693 [Xylaria grammica]
MADPLSIAGLVTGVISLGLQVAGGLSDYLDAVKGRAEELNSSKRQAINMRDLLLTIQDLLPQLQNNWPASASTIERHINSCNAEISTLHTLLSGLSRPASSSTGIRLKLAEQKQKLTYPFDRAQLSCLEDRLAKVNSALQTALHVTGLNISITTSNQIQQVHNTLAAMSQSITTQTRSTAARLSLPATSVRPEEITGGRAELQLYSAECAVALASKPSLLSGSIESLATLDSLPELRAKATGGAYTTCLCRTYRKMSYSRGSWCHFSFSYKNLNTRHHLPSCPFYQINGEAQATNFTIEYDGFRKLLQTAFVLSFTNTHGAGGRSISPGFTYYPVVDSQTAPAFRIMDLTYIIAGELCDHASETSNLLQHCFNSILTLYSQRRASPKDTNEYGWSLLHEIANIVAQNEVLVEDRLVADVVFSGTNNLIACGIPVTMYNGLGDTPCSRAIQEERITDRGIEFARLLIPSESDMPLLRAPEERFWWLSGSNCLRVLLQHVDFAEAAGCGPLGLAAIAGNEKLVQDIIRQHPQHLKEMNQFRHTPLHLSINHPACLRLILGVCEPSMLHEKDAYSETPLGCACLLGYTTSTELLLAAGSYLSSSYIGSAHVSCRDALLVAFKQRRSKLKLLALDTLGEMDARRLGLHEDIVLDSRAIEVQELLQKKGISIPLNMLVQGDAGSVYHHYYHSGGHPSTDILEKLWTLGFRDVNSFDMHGNVPLEFCGHELERARWLIEHGGDYWTPLNERKTSTNQSTKRSTEPVAPAHGIMCYIGGTERQPNKDLETQRWLLEKLLQVQVGDACSCPCMIGGCVPLKAYFDGRFRHPDSRNGIALARNSAWEWVTFIQTYQAYLGERDLNAAIRRATFDALELIHTCCSYIGPLGYYSPYDSDETDEIHSEQKSLLGLFADLLLEFERFSYDDQSGRLLIASDPEEFWIRRWLPRITETLDGLDGNKLTEEEISAGEAIGVVWGPQPPPETETIVEPEWTITPEYIMGEIEKIMNE